MKMAHREAGLSFLVGKLWVQILGRPPLAVQVWAILPTSLHLFSSICITIIVLALKAHAGMPHYGADTVSGI